MLRARLGEDRSPIEIVDGTAILLGVTPLGDVADPKRRRELRVWFESALSLGWDRRLVDDAPLGDLVPPALLVPDSRVGPRQLDSRLRSSLERAGVSRWSTLLASRLSDLSDGYGFGPVAVASLLGACFERGLLGLTTASVTDQSDDLGTILELERRGPDQPVLESLLDSVFETDAASPDPVSNAPNEAARRLLEGSAPWALQYQAQLLELLQAIGDDQDRSIFVRAELGCGPRASLTELGAEIGISSSRVGQRRDRAAEQLRDELAASPAPLEWVVRRVRRSLGLVAPLESVAGELRRHGLADQNGRSDSGRAARLLLWLAGPYRHDARVPGWLVVGTDDFAARTKNELGKDGGVRSLAEMAAWLVQVGVARHLVVPWLESCGAAVVDDDLCVCLTGTLRDVLERLIDAHGRGVSVEECGELLGAGGRVAAGEDLERALRARRFRSLAGGIFELSTWPPVPPGTRAARRAPRSVEIRSSVGRSVPGGECSGHFEPGHESDGEQLNLPGVERLASLETDQIESVTWGHVPGACPRPSDPDAPVIPVRAWLTVEIDAALLRGASSVVPDALVRALGIGLGQRRTFASRYGPLTISNYGPEPVRSPLRPLALGAGAALGDSLAIGLGADGDVVVEVNRTTVDPSPLIDSDAWESGHDPRRDGQRYESDLPELERLGGTT
jgi:hypothetical protein